MVKCNLNNNYKLGNSMSYLNENDYINSEINNINRNTTTEANTEINSNDENTDDEITEDDQIDIKKLKNHVKDTLIVNGLTGFVNQGNTCYLNCVLQCLMSTEYLISYFLDNEYEEDLNRNQLKYILKKKEQMGLNIKITKNILNETKKNTMTYDFYTLLKNYWSEKGINITPKSIKKRIGKLSEDFSGSRQNDSEEALNIILDKLHEELLYSVEINNELNENLIPFMNIYNLYGSIINDNNKSIEDKIRIGKIIKEYTKVSIDEFTVIKSCLYWNHYLKDNYSIIKKVFTGLYLSKVKCSKCGYYNGTFDPFDSIQLQLPQKNNITLDDCFNQFFKIELLKNDNKYNCIKCQQKVEAIKKIEIWTLPNVLIIQLKRFESFSMFPKKKNDNVECLFTISLEKYCSKLNKLGNFNYELYGVCNHYGGTQGGHYTANVKNPLNNLWFEFNDESIYHIDTNNVITNSAYLLFYKRIIN
jgi:ubiquitin carboxyl-terminal hydrolase 8